MAPTSKLLLRRGVESARRIHLHIEEILTKKSPRRDIPKFFNLDLHISVIRDLLQELNRESIQTVKWSISGSNAYSRRFYKVSDPVDVVNSKTWAELDEELISKFESRYGSFLEKFDGFIVTHTPAFSQLYRKFQKPILVLNSTRYEAPYTEDEQKWDSLNTYLAESVSSGNMLIASNNLGDLDYLKFHTGLDSRYVPSYCDYTKLEWEPGGSQRLVIAKSPKLEEFVEQLSGNKWKSFRKLKGRNFKWEQYLNVCELLVIPYNISTMSLFELATAGVPVVMPTSAFLKKLSTKFEGVLSELSYFQLQNLDVSALEYGSPNNFISPNFQDWWLERADFYNSELMPNVRLIDSFDELNENRKINKSYFEVLKSRNFDLELRRRNLLKDFIQMV